MSLPRQQNYKFRGNFVGMEPQAIDHLHTKTSLLAFLIGYYQSMNYECNKLGFTFFVIPSRTFIRNSHIIFYD